MCAITKWLFSLASNIVLLNISGHCAVLVLKSKINQVCNRNKYIIFIHSYMKKINFNCALVVIAVYCGTMPI